MTGKTQENLGHTPDDIEIKQFVLGENPTPDEDSIVQYSRDMSTVGLRNELIRKYAGGDIFNHIGRQIINEVRPHAKIVTVGAGTGQMEYEIASAVRILGAEVVATDLYPHYQMYEEEAEATGLDNLSYLEADARELPFEDDTFDIAVAAFVAYHVRGEKGGPEQVIKELHRVLRPGGKLIFGTRGPQHMKQIWDLYLPAMARAMTEKSSLIEYKSPPSWYDNCDLPKSQQLLQEIFGNMRITFDQVSPESFINIPGTKKGWEDLSYILRMFKENFRPAPPDAKALSPFIEEKIKRNFFKKAQINEGFYPLKIEQAVFEAIKTPKK